MNIANVKRLSDSEVKKLKDLRNKIEHNIASDNDYADYKDLIVKGGMSEDEIFQRLKKYNLRSIDEYKNVRKRKSKSAEEEMLGTVLGLGLLVLMLWGISKSSSK
jgi:hypothetical protein